MEKLTRNAARCNLCGETVESKREHDFVQCSCGSLAVDGGLQYARRLGDDENITDLNEWE